MCGLLVLLGPRGWLITCSQSWGSGGSSLGGVATHVAENTSVHTGRALSVA